MTVRMMILNWVHDTSAKVEVLLSEELMGETVCTIGGWGNVLLVDEYDVDTLMFIVGGVNPLPSGPGTYSREFF